MSWSGMLRECDCSHPPRGTRGPAARLLLETRIGDWLPSAEQGLLFEYGQDYNSFPDAAEVMISENGSVELIRKRQTLDQIVQNEVVHRFCASPRGEVRLGDSRPKRLVLRSASVSRAFHRLQQGMNPS